MNLIEAIQKCGDNWIRLTSKKNLIIGINRWGNFSEMKTLVCKPDNGCYPILGYYELTGDWEIVTPEKAIKERE